MNPNFTNRKSSSAKTLAGGTAAPTAHGDKAGESPRAAGAQSGAGGALHVAVRLTSFFLLHLLFCALTAISPGRKILSLRTDSCRGARPFPERNQ